MENKYERLKDVTCFLLDMDGTIYLEDVLFDKVKETIELMRKKGRIIFLTNNSSKSVSTYIEKLAKMGIEITQEEIYTSGQATCEYLNTFHLHQKVCLLGTNALKEEFSKHQIPLDDVNPDICVMGYDTELTYPKLVNFTNHLNEQKYFIASHPDINCPASPYFVPDIGAMLEMIKVSTRRTPDVIIGKPYKIMGENIMRKYHLMPNQIAMIGDRLYTDIAFALSSSFVSILVLSGETSMEDYTKDNKKVDIVLEQISDLISYL